MSISKKLIAGLGNPGKQYEKTRHNIGFMFMDYIASELSAPGFTKDFEALISRVRFSDQELCLCKPQSYMNLSGRSIRSFVSYFKLSLSDIIVVCDDFSIPFGVLRIRMEGSDGGHNGLKSIISELSARQFIRLRMGVGPLPQNMDPADFVLSEFGKMELELIYKYILPAAKEGVMDILANGGVHAMNHYNRFYLPGAPEV